MIAVHAKLLKNPEELCFNYQEVLVLALHSVVKTVDLSKPLHPKMYRLMDLNLIPRFINFKLMNIIEGLGKLIYTALFVIADKPLKKRHLFHMSSGNQKVTYFICR